MHPLNSDFPIDQKLHVIQPYISLSLYYNSIDYRRQLIALIKQHEKACKKLTKRFNQPQTPEVDDNDEYDCELGYN